MKLSDLDTILDNYVDKVFLWAVPHSVKPNYFTYFRIASAPVIFWFLWSGHLRTGFILFVLSMLTDLIDGALARTRNQITNLGKVVDPIADKLLILVVFLYIGMYLPVALYLSIFIIVELIGVITGIVMNMYLGPVKHAGANTFGKIKMWLQCIGIILFAVSIFTKTVVLQSWAVGLLVASLLFAVVSAYAQCVVRWKQFSEYRASKRK